MTIPLDIAVVTDLIVENNFNIVHFLGNFKIGSSIGRGVEYWELNGLGRGAAKGRFLRSSINAVDWLMLLRYAHGIVRHCSKRHFIYLTRL